jgi:flagella basal body P-ring formation protein FlgA
MASMNQVFDWRPCNETGGVRVPSFFRVGLFGLILLTLGSCPTWTVFAEQDASKGRISNVTLTMRSTAQCPSNILLLTDIVEIKGSDALIQQISDLVIAPAPKLGQKQSWRRASIEKVLQLRGLPSEAIRWAGADECSVVRVDGQRAPTTDLPNVAQLANDTPSDPTRVTSTAYADVATANSVTANGIATNIVGTIDTSRFTPSSTTPVTITMAERNAADAISNYLKTKTNSNGQWIIQPKIPSEYAKALSTRVQIEGVNGGQPPWEGQQEFVFLLRDSKGMRTINVQAMVKLPEMVVAANRPLSKGYVLRDSDLVWIPMPRGLSYGPEDCFATPDALIGQQLRRSVSTQQVIRQSEVGAPTVVQVGNVITVEVVSGDIVVATNGRAIEAGSMDDLIQVEVEPSKNRVLGRITGPKTVEVIANSGRIPIANNKNNSNRNTLRR